MVSGPMISTTGLTKSFGSFTAVDAADMAVERGSIHGFVGPNGAGKTTTIKMLIGGLRATSGEAWIGGHPIGSHESRAMLGYAPEHPSLYDDMTAFDFLVYMARVCGVPRKVAGERAHALLDSLDLGEFADRGSKNYSAGQRQRLCLAQAMIHEPELLILDEPTANMDPTGRLAIMDRLVALAREQGTTIFLSSHILPELEQIVDSITMINHGKIVVSGGVDQLRAQFSGNQYLLRTSANEAVLEILRNGHALEEGWIDVEDFVHLVSEDGEALRREIMQAVSDAGAALDHISEDRTSLPDIYRKMVGMDEEEE